MMEIDQCRMGRTAELLQGELRSSKRRLSFAVNDC